MAQFLAWFKIPILSWGIYEATRRRAEAIEQSWKPQPAQNRMGRRLNGMACRAEQIELNRGRSCTKVRTRDVLACDKLSPPQPGD
jgi:hypothetical protein